MLFIYVQIKNLKLIIGIHSYTWWQWFHKYKTYLQKSNYNLSIFDRCLTNGIFNVTYSLYLLYECVGWTLHLRQSLNNKMSQAKLWCIDENFPLHIKPPLFWTHDKCPQYCSNVYCIQDILSHWILIGVPMWRHRLVGAGGGAVQGLAWNHAGLPWWLRR